MNPKRKSTDMGPPPKRPKLYCDVCGQGPYQSRKNLLRHAREKHGTEHGFKCDECDATYTRRNKLMQHIQSMHSQQSDTPYEQALNGTFKKFKRQPSATVKYDPMSFLQDQYQYVNDLLSRHIERSPLKWYISMKVKFIRKNTDTYVTATPGFQKQATNGVTSKRYKHIPERIYQTSNR